MFIVVGADRASSKRKIFMGNREVRQVKKRLKYFYLPLAALSLVLFIGVNAQAEGNSNGESSPIQVPLQVGNAYEIEPRFSEWSREFQGNSFIGSPLVMPISDLIADDDFVTREIQGYHREEVVRLQRGSRLELQIEVERAGVYALAFDYYNLVDSLLNIEFALKVNGQFPFRELRRLQFTNNWINRGEVSRDRFGNEIVPTPEMVFEWLQGTLLDSTYRNSEPLGIYLQQGLNILTLDVSEGNFLLGDLTLKSPNRTLSAYVPGTVSGTQMIVIEAENMTQRNASSIRAGSSFNVDMSPSNPTRRVLNHLDGSSFRTPGQRIDYTFMVEEAGYYYLAFLYQGDQNIDFPVFREIRINGEIPNEQLVAYPFPFTRNLRELVVSDGNTGNHMTFFFEAGENTLSLIVNVAPVSHIIERLEDIMVEINEFALQINRLTGGTRDRNRTFDLERFIPDASQSLESWADELDAFYESVRPYSPDVRRIAAFNSLQVVSSILRGLAAEPNQIPVRVGELTDGGSSAISLLAGLNQSLDSGSLTLDRIFITQDVGLLPASSNLWQRAANQVHRFFNSFVDEDFAPQASNPENLQVWVNRPRQYIEILQQMADVYFTPETGISVDFSIMPDEGRLTLANASGTAPDVAQSITFTLPFEFALREAAVDLTQFDGFDEIASRIPEGLFIPSTIGHRIYSIPETMNFTVLFYREDILNALNIPVPDTIDEVISILPDLQRLGMNFFHPAGTPGMRGFAAVLPLIYQHGGSFYGETVESTTINSEESIAGFRQLTDLFTIYNLPYEVPNFYQSFRSGILPIGISGFNTYMLLLNAAPELANLWNIALIPGVENADGQVMRHTTGGEMSSMIFQSSEMQEEAWQYLQWWASTETQANFGQRLQSTFGPEFLWNPANLEALAQLPWNSSHRDIIIEQSRWIDEAPRVPGTYMLERELSTAFINTVLEGESVRRAIDLAVRRTNRETWRRLEEFGYVQNGELVRPFYTPRVDLAIIGKEDE